MANNEKEKMVCPQCGTEMDYLKTKPQIREGWYWYDLYYRCLLCGFVDAYSTDAAKLHE